MRDKLYSILTSDSKRCRCVHRRTPVTHPEQILQMMAGMRYQKRMAVLPQTSQQAGGDQSNDAADMVPDAMPALDLPGLVQAGKVKNK